VRLQKKLQKLKIALLCGGPSPERGISLNSARSVLDHLLSEEIDILPIYFNAKKQAFKITRAQLYCNTPSDFDFKLKQTALPLNEKELINFLKETDIVFPVIHGVFGEDGKLQTWLEKNNIPYIGSGSSACKKAFDKYIANEYIKANGFFVLPSIVLKIGQKDQKRQIDNFFKEHTISRAVVKPAGGGSSIGVFSVSSPADALKKAEFLFSQRLDTRLVIEPFAKGTEFTTIILENRFSLPVALPPTEIETDYTKHQIFDYRKKYLPTRQVIWHCPPRFEDKIIEKIEAQAEQIFALFKMHDFSRFDGWVMPDGNIWFNDFNPISGMEQNSFLFQQASRIGFTHADVLRFILKNACRRHGIRFPEREKTKPAENKRKIIYVLFGGKTSERQVSLMSGTNVWLKLRGSKFYEPKPYLLDKDNNVWKLPYHLTLNHTVEEITENCINYDKAKKRLASFEQRARIRLGLKKNLNNEFFEPVKMGFKNFLKDSKFVFIALHGGSGENGVLQNLLTKNKIKFNGPDGPVSRLCMDKSATSASIQKLNINGVLSIPNKSVATEKILRYNKSEIKKLWEKIKFNIDAKTIVVKPGADGCSTGIVRLDSADDLVKYLKLLSIKKPFVQTGISSNKDRIIEMPPEMPSVLIFEKFIDTDILKVEDSRLKYKYNTGWIEITVGVIETDKKLKSLNPSITVAENEVLTVEEKFQGGTGINITPPPLTIIKPKELFKIKKSIEKISVCLGLKGYSRIDAFANIKTGDLMIIEINTLPGLTPSTVLYHQALAENPPVFPKELLELLIKNKNY
jgi:D-alanine--D-alanine ligase